MKAGDKFGRLTAVHEDTSKKDRAWLFKCDCGVEKVVLVYNITNGSTRSCGCLRRDTSASLAKTHGKTDTAEYSTWCGIIYRCENPNYREFHFYGGRGISICPRWRNDFTAFLEDMGPKPSSKHSIEREDTNGNYEPGNCRWATAKEQSNNQRSNRIYTARGKSQTIAQWADETGIPYPTLCARLVSLQWVTDKALSAPPRKIKR